MKTKSWDKLSETSPYRLLANVEVEKKPNLLFSKMKFVIACIKDMFISMMTSFFYWIKEWRGLLFSIFVTAFIICGSGYLVYSSAKEETVKQQILKSILEAEGNVVCGELHYVSTTFPAFKLKKIKCMSSSGEETEIFTEIP